MRLPIRGTHLIELLAYSQVKYLACKVLWNGPVREGGAYGRAEPIMMASSTKLHVQLGKSDD